MDERITAALALTADSTMRDRTVDITTIGARSGEPRRIEIWFHDVDGVVYLTGSPGTRGWYANLLAEPRFVFHLKHEVQADLSAVATAIVDRAERERLFAEIIAGIDELYARIGSPQRVRHPEQWVAGSPLVRVEFDEPHPRSG